MACKRFLKRCKVQHFSVETQVEVIAQTAKQDKIRKLGLIEKKKKKKS